MIWHAVFASFVNNGVIFYFIIFLKMTDLFAREDTYLSTGVMWINLKLPKYGFLTFRKGSCCVPFTFSSKTSKNVSSAEERKSYTVNLGWVNNQETIFGWTVPLHLLTKHKDKNHTNKHLTRGKVSLQFTCFRRCESYDMRKGRD